MKLAEKEPSKSASSKANKTKKAAAGQETIKPKAVKKELSQKFPVRCNLEDYETTYNTFSWDDAKEEISYFAGGKVNAAYNAVDRHLVDGRKNKVALYSIGADGELSKYTFLEIYEQANRLGNALKSLGVKRGDRVFVFLPRVAELYIATIAIAKIGAIAGPLFSAFGPDALRDRLQDSEAKIVITNPALKDKLDIVKKDLPDLEKVVVVGAKGKQLQHGEVCYDTLVAGQSSELKCEQMDPEDPLYLLYTSGTTGKPKGVVHVHADIIGHHMTTKWVLDLKDDDIYW